MYESILEFVLLQNRLTTELRIVNSNSVDFDYFLDFPRKGTLSLNGEEWEFLRHGLGFRFTRQGSLPHLIVDSHVKPFEYGIVDDWRIQQFLESKFDRFYDKYEIKKSLEDLSLKNKLIKITAHQYKIII